MNTEQATDQTIDISNEISEAIAEIMDVADDLRRTEVDELVEVQWNGCTNGEKVADRIERLLNVNVEYLADTINEISNEISNYDDAGMADHVELETRELDSNLELYQERLEAAANRLGAIVLQDTPQGTLPEVDVVRIVSKAIVQMINAETSHAQQIERNQLVTVEDWIDHKISHAKRETWEAARRLVNEAYEAILYMNKCAVDTKVDVSWSIPAEAKEETA